MTQSVATPGPLHLRKDLTSRPQRFSIRRRRRPSIEMSQLTRSRAVYDPEPRSEPAEAMELRSAAAASLQSAATKRRTHRCRARWWAHLSARSGGSARVKMSTKAARVIRADLPVSLLRRRRQHNPARRSAGRARSAFSLAVGSSQLTWTAISNALVHNPLGGVVIAYQGADQFVSAQKSIRSICWEWRSSGSWRSDGRDHHRGPLGQRLHRPDRHDAGQRGNRCANEDKLDLTEPNLRLSSFSCMPSRGEGQYVGVHEESGWREIR